MDLQSKLIYYEKFLQHRAMFYICMCSLSFIPGTTQATFFQAEYLYSIDKNAANFFCVLTVGSLSSSQKFSASTVSYYADKVKNICFIDKLFWLFDSLSSLKITFILCVIFLGWFYLETFSLVPNLHKELSFQRSSQQENGSNACVLSRSF